MRIRISFFIIIVMFLLLVGGLSNLQILRKKQFRQLSDKNCIRLLPQEGSRGRIFDRNQNIIVGNQISYDVMVSPQNTKELDATLKKISSITGVSFSELKQNFKKGYVSSFASITIIKNIDIKKAIALQELRMDYNGIVINSRPVRDYPYGKLACHLLGHLGEIDRWRLTKLEDYGYKTKDIVGFGGVEDRYDYYLRQEEGGTSLEVDHRGRVVRILGFKPPKSGKDIQLTIDLRIQKIVEDNLDNRKGSVIIMDPYTGEIIAMASSPGFDPAWFVDRDNKNLSKIFSDKDAPLLNRSIGGVYPPGSVFKIVVAAGALELNKINSLTSFLCTGSTRIGNRQFKCWDTHGTQDLVQALAHSCDIFFYKTGLLLGAQQIHDYSVRFGLSKLTGIDLPYEASGFVPDPIWRRIYKLRNWFDGDTANFSIGQGDLLTTPIQMTRATAVFANGGYLVTPYLVKSVAGQDITTTQRKAAKINFKPDTIFYVREGMKDAVAYPTGTASVLSAVPLAIAGKTGTVQVPRGQPHAWFVGFLPFREPKFVICVFLEHGGSGQASCVLARHILDQMVKEGLI